jgi:cephalosporin-C deacetylase-like acetyl esterase
MLRRTILVLTFSSVVALAQTRHTAEERYAMFQQYLVRRAASVTQNNLADVTTLEKWQQRRPIVRQQLLYMLGLDPMPKKKPLNVRVTKRLERDTYNIENIVFESMPGLYVTGNLYVPKDVKGPLPAILYVCGHAPGPWGAKVNYQHHGVWWARHGYVAFMIDTIEFGEVPGIHHGTHDLEMWDWISLGYTPAGPEVWNGIRALDYLETRSEVDPKRMAITGISGGGAMTWYGAAVDERLQAGASVCATWTVEHHTKLDAVHENCDCIYFMNTFQVDLPSVGALIAPRPFMMLSARRDPSFPVAGYKEAFQRTLPIYKLYGAADKIAEYDHDAPHADLPPFRKEADEWLNRWLKKDTTPFDEGIIQRETPETLTVLSDRPANAINDQIHRRFIVPAKLEPQKSLASWKKRKDHVLNELNDKVFRAFPTSKVPFETWKGIDKGWPSRYADTSYVEFTTEDGIRVNGQLFVPRDPARQTRALIYVKGSSDVVYPVDYDLLLPALGQQVVLVLEPRGVNYPMSNYKLATIKRTAVLQGSSLESMQIWDILRSVDFLKDDQHLPLSAISVYGRRSMGPLGIYAAAFDPRITRVILDDAPASHWQGPALLNVLRITDLPEAAALIAPRPLVSITALPNQYDYTRSIYKLYGKSSSIREVGGLSEALQ